MSLQEQMRMMDLRLQDIATTTVQENNATKAAFQQKAAQMGDKQFQNASPGSAAAPAANQDFVLAIFGLPRESPG